MRASFHLVYRYIFCLQSRRLMQIAVQALKIIYSYNSLRFIRLAKIAFIALFYQSSYRYCFRHETLLIGQCFCAIFFFCLTTCTWFFFFFGMHIASFFFVYWHERHSSLFTVVPWGLQLHFSHAHTPLASECALTLQWQSHKHSLHFVICVQIVPKFFKFYFYPL